VSERDAPFSQQLEDWLGSDEPKTLGALGDVVAEKSFAVTILVLMFVPALPAPTGGVTHVFELITMLVAFEMIIGRTTLWIPARLASRGLGPVTTGKAVPFMIRWIRRAERHSNRRGATLFGQRWLVSLIGLIVLLFALGAALAPPFSGLDTFPALGAVGVALAIILEDVVVLAVATVLGLVGLLITITLGATIVRLLRGLLG